MTDEQVIKEIVERRRQWGKTRDSDFEWLMGHVEMQQKKIKQLHYVLGKSDTKLIKIREILDSRTI